MNYRSLYLKTVVPPGQTSTSVLKTLLCHCPVTLECAQFTMAEKKRSRVSDSATSTDSDTSFLITKGEIESLVADSVRTALDKFEKSLLVVINSKMEAIQKRMEKLEEQQERLESAQMDVEVAVEKAAKASPPLISRCNELEEQVSSLKTQVRAAEALANANEQYSRRNNIRIRGLAVADNNCKMTVSNFISNTLGLRDDEGRRLQLKPTDIEAAHPLHPHPRRQTSRQTTQPTIIVRFHDRDLRDRVISCRKQLKGKPITITDDLTSRNQQMLMKLRESPLLESAWTWHGKVLGKLKSSNRIINYNIHDIITDH